VLAAEAKKAGIASDDTHLIPRPPSFDWQTCLDLLSVGQKLVLLLM